MNKSVKAKLWPWLMAASVLLLSAWMLTGCSDPELFEECVRDEECAEDEICLNLLCQPPQCDTDEIACGRNCVNPRIELEFCGGCNGCPGTDNAEGIQCLEGQCIYRCLDGFVDVNDDINDPNGDGCECVPDGPEVCDGVDNDCDGLVDAMDDNLEPCDAEDGTEAACIAGACELACSPGLVDVNGDLGTGGNGCECEPTGEEICDGIDNDCDGLTDIEDEDLEVSDEVCDGIDNDCDGDVDGDDDDFTLPTCQLTQGICQGSLTRCDAGSAVECSVDQYTRHAASQDGRFQNNETFCDNIDNDCDGQTDELCCGEGTNATELISRDERFISLFDAASNSEGSLTAVAIAQDGNAGVILVREDLSVAHESFNILANTFFIHRVDIHWSTPEQAFRLVQAEDERLLFRSISTTGQLSSLRSIELGFTLVDLQTFDLAEDRFLVVGLTDDHRIVGALIDTVEGTLITTTALELDGEVRLSAISNLAPLNSTQFEAAINFYTLGGEFGIEQTHQILWLGANVQGGSALQLEEKQIIARPVHDDVGRRSDRAFIEQDRLYHVRQDSNTLTIAYTTLNSNNFTTVHTLVNNEEFRFLHIEGVVEFDDHIVLVADTEPGLRPLVRDDELGGVSGIQVSLLNTNTFHKKRLVPTNLGALAIMNVQNADGEQTDYTLGVALLNEEGSLLCP